MVSYPSLNVRPNIGRIKLNPKPEIEPVKLNIEKRFDFDDFKDLDREILSSIDVVTKSIEEYADRSRKQYELFVLSELHNRGYDLQRLENSHCWRRITPISFDSERVEYYVDDVLVLTVKQTTRFEDIEHKYMVYTDFEVED